MEVIINIGMFLFLVALGFGVGSYVEKEHYKEISSKERTYLELPVVTSKDLEGQELIVESQMVMGNVVISQDYFKRLLASLRNIFGGRMSAYETLMDRARREAILRMKKEAYDRGYHLILNMRFETSTVGQVTEAQASLGCFEVLAYGTAIKLNV